MRESKIYISGNVILVNLNEETFIEPTREEMRQTPYGVQLYILFLEDALRINENIPD